MNLNDKKNVFFDENYTKNEDDTILVANVSNKLSNIYKVHLEEKRNERINLISKALYFQV